MTGSPFWLTVVSANLGRGYRLGVYDRNVDRIMRHLDGVENWALLLQEVDEEPDPANEHRRLRVRLPKGARRVHWRTREPIVLSPSFRVVKRWKPTLLMGSGLAIGGPRGTGPERRLSSCVARHRASGIDLGFATWHPHRSGFHPRVDEARDAAVPLTRAGLLRVRAWDDGTSGAYGTDYNSRRMPRFIPGERTAEHDGLDHLRYWQHPHGADLALHAHGVIDGTIDGHDFPWARFRVTAGS